MPSASVTDASVFAEETLKYDGVIVVHVFRSVAKRRVRLLNLAFQLLDDGGILLQLVPIPALELVHLAGSWPNHRRSAGLGAISFNQMSTAASCLLNPRGHSRSTRMRMPSLSSFGSWIRLMRKAICPPVIRSKAILDRIRVIRFWFQTGARGTGTGTCSDSNMVAN